MFFSFLQGLSFVFPTRPFFPVVLSLDFFANSEVSGDERLVCHFLYFPAFRDQSRTQIFRVGGDLSFGGAKNPFACPSHSKGWSCCDLCPSLLPTVPLFPADSVIFTRLPFSAPCPVLIENNLDAFGVRPELFRSWSPPD